MFTKKLLGINFLLFLILACGGVVEYDNIENLPKLKKVDTSSSDNNISENGGVANDVPMSDPQEAPFVLNPNNFNIKDEKSLKYIEKSMNLATLLGDGGLYNPKESQEESYYSFALSDVAPVNNKLIDYETKKVALNHILDLNLGGDGDQRDNNFVVNVYRYDDYKAPNGATVGGQLYGIKKQNAIKKIVLSGYLRVYLSNTRFFTIFFGDKAAIDTRIIVPVPEEEIAPAPFLLQINNRIISANLVVLDENNVAQKGNLFVTTSDRSNGVPRVVSKEIYDLASLKPEQKKALKALNLFKVE